MIGYKIERNSKRAREFVVANAGIFASLGHEVGKLPLVVSGVWIHIIEMHGELKVMIEVGEDATHADLREAETYALMWRDRLLEWQGPWTGGGDTLFLEELDSRQKGDNSYAELAKMANNLLASYLYEFSAFQTGFEEARLQGNEKQFWKTIREGTREEGIPSPFSFGLACDLLKVLGIKENEHEQLLLKGLRRIREDTPPFEEGTPVSREKMISVLRTWREGKKHLLLTSLQDESDSSPSEI